MRVAEHRPADSALSFRPNDKYQTVVLLLLVSLILFLCSTFILYGINPASGSEPSLYINQESTAEHKL